MQGANDVGIIIRMNSLKDQIDRHFTEVLANDFFDNACNHAFDSQVLLCDQHEDMESLDVDPGPTPAELLDVPGFVHDVMQYSLDNAPYPDRALAFAGALSLQALMAGRKVRDSGDNRTNLYVVALANSGAGKNFPRTTNEKILLYAGMADCLGDEIGSAEGRIDPRAHSPSIDRLGRRRRPFLWTADRL
jgi:hypothetical protein